MKDKWPNVFRLVLGIVRSYVISKVVNKTIIFVLLGVLCARSCSGWVHISHCIRNIGTSEGRVGACIILGRISLVYGCQNWRWLHKVCKNVCVNIWVNMRYVNCLDISSAFGAGQFKSIQCHPGLTYIFNFWHLGTLALSPERQSAQMSEIKNVG